MEPVNGFELCSYIRPHLSCPIIFLTAKELEADKVEGLFRGADDYIVKPFWDQRIAGACQGSFSAGGKTGGAIF